MKAFSIKQPWANLIIHGLKDVENRTWRTNFRGRILIHASAKRISGIDYTFAQRVEILKGSSLEYVPVSAIIGSVEIVDCVHSYSTGKETIFPYKSIWAEKNVWNWVLRNPVLF